MRIKTRLRFNAIAAVGLILVIASSLAWSFVAALGIAQKENLASQMQRIAVERVLLRNDYQLYMSQRAKTQWFEKTAVLEGLIDQAQARFTEPKEKELLRDVRKAFDGTVIIVSNIIEIRERGRDTGQGPGILIEGERRLVAQLLAQIHTLNTAIAMLRESASRDASAAFRRALLLILVFSAMAVAVTILNSFFLDRLLAKRIILLRRGAETIGRGNLDHHLAVTGDDELVDLARAVNEMAARLKESYTSVEVLEREIAERTQAEAALRESEEKFRWIFESANVGKSITLLSGEIDVNRAFCDMLGYGREELKEKRWQELTPGEDVGAIEGILKPLLEGSADSARFNKRYRHKKGFFVWCDVSVAIRRDTAGKPLHFITTVVDITERKRAEEELAKREHLLQKIFDVLPIGLWFADGDGTLLRGNPAGVRIWGAEMRVGPSEYGVFKARRLPSGEPVGAHDWALVRTVQEGLTIVDEVLEIDAFDGETKTILNYSAPVLDDNGRVEGAIVVNLDITALRKAEESLRKEQEFMQLLLETSPAFYVAIGADGKTLKMNRALLEALEYGDEEVRGVDYLSAFVPEDDRAELAAIFRQIIREGKAAVNENRIVSKSGRLHLVEWHGQPVSHAGGQGDFFVGVGIDVTQRRLAERAVKENEERLATLIGNLPGFVYRCANDRDWTMLFISDGCAKITGYDPDDFLYNRRIAYNDIVHPRYQERLWQKWQDLLSRREAFEDEYPIVSADGSVRWVWERGRGIFSDGGELLFLEGFITDITARKQAEEENKRLNTELEQRVRDRTIELEAANKELEAFAYSVSHDLRAPLRAMEGFSSALLSDYRERMDEQGIHYLERIGGASRRMGQLINDLLNLSRISRQELTRKAVDLAALAQEIGQELQSQDRNRLVRLLVAPNLTAWGDARLLRIVFVNLLNNAWKFTGRNEETRIEVGAAVNESGETVYYVKDNGVGFDMAYADKLFAPFQRLHGVNEFPGTGIGLATVQRIVARHGGRVWAEAKVGEGATVHFVLAEPPLTGGD